MRKIFSVSQNKHDAGISKMFLALQAQKSLTIFLNFLVKKNYRFPLLKSFLRVSLIYAIDGYTDTTYRSVGRLF